MAPSEKLAALADALSVLDAQAHPERATAGGDHRFDHLLTAFSDAGRALLGERARALRADLTAAASEGAALDEDDRLTRDVLAAKLDEEVVRAALDGHRFTLDPLDGPHLAFLELIDEDHPRRDLGDGETLLARLHAAPAMLADHRAQLHAGLADGLTAPRLLAARVAQQLDALVDGTVSATLERAIADIERVPGGATLAASLRRAVPNVLLAYAALRSEVRERLLPAAREIPGLCALPTGDAAYRALARLHTTTDLDPAALEALGREGVAAAEEELRAAASRLGHAYPSEARAALAAAVDDGDPLAPARDFLARAARVLPTAFRRLPAARCALAAVPPSQGERAPAAYYIPAADGDDHGTFFVNLHRAQRPRPHRLALLTAHEALPGHHLQLGLAIESPSLPPFRRRVEFTAYVEGWALYAERLADELGLYDDAARFALAEHRAWRAARLVVDTGLHARGWSVDEAHRYLAAHAPLSEAQVAQEIERQVADPGQALAYAVGERAFSSLREAARSRLGDGFTLSGFHERVLAPGALPLATLTRHVEAWNGS